MAYELDEKRHPLELLVVNGKLDEARQFIKVKGAHSYQVSYTLWHSNRVEDALFLVKEATTYKDKIECLASAFRYFMGDCEIYTNTTTEDYSSFIKLMDYLKEEMNQDPKMLDALMQEYPFKNLDQMFKYLCWHNYHQMFTELSQFFNYAIFPQYVISPQMASRFLIEASMTQDHNQPEMIAKLLVLGGDPGFLDYEDKDSSIIGYMTTTPLHEAAERFHVEKMKLLLQAGADVNCKNHNSRTALEKLLSRVVSSTNPRVVNKNPLLGQSIDCLLKYGAITQRPKYLIEALALRVLYRDLNLTTTDGWQAPRVREFKEMLKLLDEKGMKHEPLVYSCLSKLHDQQIAIKGGTIEPNTIGLEVEMLKNEELFALGNLVFSLKRKHPKKEASVRPHSVFQPVNDEQTLDESKENTLKRTYS